MHLSVILSCLARKGKCLFAARSEAAAAAGIAVAVPAPRGDSALTAAHNTRPRADAAEAADADGAARRPTAGADVSLFGAERQRALGAARHARADPRSTSRAAVQQSLVGGADSAFVVGAQLALAAADRAKPQSSAPCRVRKGARCAVATFQRSSSRPCAVAASGCRRGRTSAARAHVRAC